MANAIALDVTPMLLTPLAAGLFSSLVVFMLMRLLSFCVRLIHQFNDPHPITVFDEVKSADVIHPGYDWSRWFGLLKGRKCTDEVIVLQDCFVLEWYIFADPKLPFRYWCFAALAFCCSAFAVIGNENLFALFFTVSLLLFSIVCTEYQYI